MKTCYNPQITCTHIQVYVYNTYTHIHTQQQQTAANCSTRQYTEAYLTTLQ